MTSGQKKQFFVISFWTFLAIILFSIRPNIALACDYIENDPLKGSQNIIVFSTNWCPYCKKTLNFLNELAVNYKVCDIEASDKAKMRFEQLGGSGVPLIYIGMIRINGYDIEAIQNALNNQSSGA